MKNGNENRIDFSVLPTPTNKKLKKGNGFMSRELYNKYLREKKKRKLISKILKATTAIVVAFLVVGIIGKIDLNTYNGIHCLSGVCVNGTVTLNGNKYSVKGFKDGDKLTITFDGKGNIKSIVAK